MIRRLLGAICVVLLVASCGDDGTTPSGSGGHAASGGSGGTGGAGGTGGDGGTLPGGSGGGDAGSGGAGGGSPDTDGDTIADDVDNCVGVPNVDQANADQDSFGDACDVCPSVVDDGLDTDGDGIGDACDPTPTGLELTAFVPRAGWRGADIPFEAQGSHLVSSAEIHFTNIDDVTVTFQGVVESASEDGARLQGVLPADPMRRQGIYDVTVVVGDASFTLEAAYTVASQPPPAVTDVAPPFAWNGDRTDGILSDEAVSLRGNGFQATPGVYLERIDDPRQRFGSIQTSFVDATTVNIVVPSETLGMPAGDYHVLVENPDGQSAYWTMPGGERGVFTIKPSPPPVIFNLDPPRNAAAASTSVRIVGRHLTEASVVELLDAAGTAVQLTPAVTFVSPEELTVQIPAGSLLNGFHPLRVRNADGQFDTFYSYQATSSAPGKLGSSTVVNTALVTPRELHGGVNLFDDFGNGYLLVAGGVTAEGGTRAVTDTVEMSPVSVFGPPGAFSLGLQWQDGDHVPARMTEPRAGAALVRWGPWVYALGGTSTDPQSGTATALGTVERARVLGVDTMPSVSNPIRVGVSGLPQGAWYYQVSAICPEGETLPSREALGTNTGGVLELRWGPVTCQDGSTATAYNVYRSPASDGRASSTRLLVAELPATELVDDGRGLLAPAPGRLRGTSQPGGTLLAGTYTYQVTAVFPDHETVAGYRVSIAAEGEGTHSIELRWDPIPGATYRVYRVDGEVGYLLADGVADTLFVDDGSLAPDEERPAPDGLRPLQPGTLGHWESAGTLLHPREGAKAVVITLPDPEDAAKQIPYLFLVGGRSAVEGGDFTADETTERTIIAPDGSLGAFELESELLNTARAYPSLVTDQGRHEIPQAPPAREPPCPDLDGDGHTNAGCGGDDCNDVDATIHPGAVDVCGDLIDQDCDGEDLACDCSVEPDADGDGHDRLECDGDDCDDANPDVHPGAEEICGDGIDQDCSGDDPSCPCEEPDADRDGYIAIRCGGDDCDDGDPTVHPGADDVPFDGIDQDCDGMDAIILNVSAPQAASEPVHLAVTFGSDGTSLLGSFEVCEVDAATGHLKPWTTQALKASNNLVMGGEALLYTAGTDQDFVWVFGGATSLPAAGQAPRTASASRRYFWYGASTPAPAATGFIADFSDPGTNLSLARAYFATVRLNAFLYHVGGTAGDGGPRASVEWQTQ